MADVFDITPFLPKNDEGNEAAKLDPSSILRAADTTPDEDAKVQKIAQVRQLPPPVVRDQLPELRRQEIIDRFSQLIDESPELQQMRQDDPFVAQAVGEPDAVRAARDETRSFTFHAKRFGSNIMALGPTIGEGLTGIAQAVPDTVDLLAMPILRAIGDPREVGDNPVSNWLREARHGFKYYGEQWTADNEKLGAGWQAAYSGVQSATQTVAAIGGALAARNPKLAIEALAGTVAGQSYGQARDEGKGVGTSVGFATTQGVLERWGEGISLGRLFKDIETNAGFWKMLGGQLATENVQEQVTTHSQDFNEWMLLHPEKSVEEFLNTRLDAAISTAIATTVGAGLTVGSVHAARKLMGDGIEVRRANEGADNLMRVVEALNVLKMRDRSPVEFRKLVDALDPSTELYVAPQDLNDALMQQDSALPTEIRDRIAEAMESATPVRLSVSEFVGYLSESAPALRDKVRIGKPDAMNVDEAAQVESEFSARAAAAIQAADDQQAAADAAEEVRLNLRAQILSTGRYDEKAADVYSALVRDFFVATAQRAGTDVTELANRYALRVTGGNAPSGAQGLNQTTELDEARLQPVAQPVQGAGPVARGYTRFRHFGNSLVPVLDPAFQGTGARGEERHRSGGPRVISLYPESREIPETGTGPVPYYVDIPTAKLYDASNDPLNLRDQARGRVDAMGYAIPGLDFSYYEQLIHDAGYLGYTIQGRSADDALAGQARIFEQIPVATPLMQVSPSDIPRAPEGTLTPEERAIEDRFATWLTYNFEEAVRQYKATTEPDSSDGGRVVNTDIARELSPDYRTDRSKSAAVHEPASWFVKQYYARALKEAPPGGVLLMAGGTGAGKSTALKGRDLSRFALIYDTNVTAVDKGAKIIDQALAAGRKVEVAYVYAHPLDTFRRAIGRARRMASKYGTGRTVPITAHAGSHAGSRNAVPALEEHYAANDDVTFAYVESGVGPVELEKLPPLEYTTTLEVIANELEKQREEGSVTEAEYLAFRGAAKGDGSQAQSEQTGGVGGEGAEGSAGARSVAFTPNEAPPGTVLNIGLAVTGGESRTPEAVAAILEAFGLAPQEMNVVPARQDDPYGPFEDTLVVRVGNTPDAATMQTLLKATEQAAIPVLIDGVGEMHVQPERMEEAVKENWAEYAPQFFNRFDGSKMAVPLEQRGAGIVRGFINFADDITASPTIMTILETANSSTFIHESGHFFFEVLTDIAAGPNPPAEVTKDVQQLFDYVGWKGTAAEWRATPIGFRRQAHEKFARSFEAWVLEGKAPSPEHRSLFQTFRAWLINTYKSVEKFAAKHGVKLTPEVRAVMGRMVATQAQLAEGAEARGIEPLFAAREAASMTEEEWQAYQDNWKAVQANAEDQLQARSMRNLRWLDNARAKKLKELQAEAAAKRAEVRRIAADAVAKRPERVAETLLLKGEAWTLGLDGEPEIVKIDGPHKLSRELLAEMYGTTEDYRAVVEDAGVDAEGARAPWHGLSPKFLAKEGMDPQVLAEMVGFTSGDQLVVELLNMRPRAEVIDAMTDAEMLRRYGDLTDKATLDRAVDIALHNQMHTRAVATEIAALEASTTAGRRDALRRTAREFAQRVIQRMQLRSIRPAQYAAGEKAAARESQAALVKGDRQMAASRKRDQLFNGYASREANRAIEMVDKGLRYLRNFNNLTTRKNLDPSYRDQIDKLLERFDLRPASRKAVEKRAALREWIAEQEEAGNEPVLPDYVLDEAQRQHYSTLTVEQFADLIAAIKNIEHLARLKHKLLANKRQADFEKARDELVASIDANATKTHADELEQDVSIFARAGKALSDFLISIRKLSSISRVMDGGKDGGMAFEYFLRPLNDAADHETRMRVAASLKLNELMKKVPGLNPSTIANVERKFTGARKLFIPAIGKSLSLEGRIMVAMNAGNEGNLDRLKTGNKWSDAQVRAVIDTLSKDEMDFVQGTLDYIDSFWPQIREKELRVSGVAPDKVEATPIDTRHGTYRGGYFPIVADPMRSDKAAQQGDAEIIKQSLMGAITRATTRRGHTKARVGGSDPVRLDLGVVVQHLNQVIHDLAWHETLIDYNKMIRDKQVSDSVRSHYGANVTAMMRRVTEDVARGEIAARTAAERMINYFRTGTTIAGLGLSVTTTLLQFTGVSQSFVRVGYKHMAKGLFTYMVAPVESTRKVWELSSFIKERSRIRNREMGEILDRVDGKSRKLMSFYFMPIQAFQTMVDIPTWLGAYNKALETTSDNDKAVALADQAVRDAQSAGYVHDLAEVQRSGPILKTLTNFYSYFSSTYQLSVESAKGFNRERSTLAALKMGTDFLMLYTFPALFALLLSHGIRGDDWDEDEFLAELAKEHAGFAMNTIPLVRELAGAIDGRSYRGPIGLSIFTDASTMVGQIAQGDMDEALFRSANRTAGTLLHYPAAQIDRTARGLIAIAEGDAPPQALLVGPPRK